MIWELESLVYFISSQRRNVIQILFESLPFISFKFYNCVAVMADCPHTIGVEFGTRIIEVSGQKIKLQIWFVFLMNLNCPPIIFIINLNAKTFIFP